MRFVACGRSLKVRVQKRQAAELASEAVTARHRSRGRAASVNQNTEGRHAARILSRAAIAARTSQASRRSASARGPWPCSLLAEPLGRFKQRSACDVHRCKSDVLLTIYLHQNYVDGPNELSAEGTSG